jgi:hypothetical protein
MQSLLLLMSRGVHAALRTRCTTSCRAGQAGGQAGRWATQTMLPETSLPGLSTPAWDRASRRASPFVTRLVELCSQRLQL